MIWIIFGLMILFVGVSAYLLLLGASRLNRKAEDMYDNDLRDLKRQGIIKKT